MSNERFPPGLGYRTSRALPSHCDSLSEEEQAAADEEAAREQARRAVIAVPEELLPAIRQLLASHKSA